MGILDGAREKELLEESITFKIEKSRKIEFLKLVKKSDVTMGGLMRLALDRLMNDLADEKLYDIAEMQ